MRAAAVQLNSTADRDRNLESADRLDARRRRARARDLVVLPEKWAVLASPEETAAGAEPLDGPALSWASAAARELGIDLVAGLDRRARRGRARPQHVRALRPRRRGARDLPQDPHVRRRGRRDRLPRVRHRRAGRRGRRLEHRRRRRAGPEHLLRPALPGALPRARRARRARDRRARRLHARHHARALGGAPARPRDRGPGLRRRRQPDRAARPGHPLRRALDDRGPVGPRARAGARQRDLRDRRARPRAPAARSARTLPSLANRRIGAEAHAVA